MGGGNCGHGIWWLTLQKIYQGVLHSLDDVGDKATWDGLEFEVLPLYDWEL